MVKILFIKNIYLVFFYILITKSKAELDVSNIVPCKNFDLYNDLYKLNFNSKSSALILI